MATPRHDKAAERPASLAARGRIRLVGLVRAVPIRWRILSIAALNSAVVVVLVAMIWNGVQVLGSAWDDVRRVREFGQDSGAAGERNRPPAEPDPSLYQSAEPGILRGDLAAARSRSRHPDHARIDRPDAVRIGGGTRARDRALPQRFRRIARRPGHHFEDLRGAGADSGERHGRALHRDRGGDRASRCPDLAAARQIPRGVYRHAGGRQRLLSFAGERVRRGSPSQHRNHRNHHPGDVRACRQRPAAPGAAAVECTNRGAAARPRDIVRAAFEPHRAVAQHHRRQPGRSDRRHRRIVGQDAAARAEGAGDIRSNAGRHLPQGAFGRRDLSRHHHQRGRGDRAEHQAAACTRS